MNLEIGYRQLLLIDPWAASRVLRLILLIGNREYDARVLIVERGGPEGEGFWLLEKIVVNSGVHISTCLRWES